MATVKFVPGNRPVIDIKDLKLGAWGVITSSWTTGAPDDMHVGRVFHKVAVDDYRPLDDKAFVIRAGFCMPVQAGDRVELHFDLNDVG
jgi:hypothetical protein